jgi:hypothetical protein
MQKDTFAEWQRLTQLYSEMGDGELEELNFAIGDLTEVAQQVLRDEMKKRALHETRAVNEESERVAAPPHNREAASPRAEAEAEEGDLPDEFTWKTVLCDCDDSESAGQIRAVLREAGIESWLEGAGSQVWDGMSNPRILVAADQLEQASEILAQPIPQAIVEQSKMQIPDYEPPVCPNCGADDPILEDTDPVNTWRCESCGKQWADPVEDLSESPAQPTRVV